MITPLDIQEKEFARSVRGYKEEEVDDFLDQIIVQMETLIKENNALKNQCGQLTEELDSRRDSDSSVTETLEKAKALMDDISASAEKRAEFLVKNAEMDAQQIVREARESAEELTESSAVLQRNFKTFKNKYRSLLESELERFDTLTNDIFPDFTINDLKDLDGTHEQPKKEKKRVHIDDGGDRNTMVFKNGL